MKSIFYLAYFLPLLFIVNVEKSDELKYIFKLSDNRDKIEVTMIYESNNHTDSINLLVPSNYDRTKLSKSVLIENLTLISEGELHKSGFDTYQYLGEHQSIILTYSIPTFSNETERLLCEGEDYFIPAINKKFFHMYGDKSLVLPQYDIAEGQLYNLEIEWVNFPEEWHIANDFGITETNNGMRSIQFAQGLLEADLGSSLFFGGEYRKTTFSHNEINFHTYLYGQNKFEDEKLISSLKKIADTEMQLWKHFHHNKEYVISITQKGEDCGRMGGRSMYDSFSFYLSGNFTEKYFPLIFANAFTHEFTHSWIGVDLVAKNPNWEEMKWFTEGFTNYYALRVNYNAGIITESQFLAILNGYIQNYLLSPYRSATNDEYVNGYRFDNKLEKLAYEKGAVFAFFLDGYIRRESANQYNIDDFMLSLLSIPSKAKIQKNLNHEIMNSISEETLEISITDLLDRYIVEGQDIPVISPLIELSELKKMTSFDYGFDFVNSMDNEIISGLKEDTNAFRNGLRNGQKLLGINGMTNKPSGKMILEVEGEEGNLIVEFQPSGSPIEIPIIKKLKPFD